MIPFKPWSRLCVVGLHCCPTLLSGKYVHLPECRFLAAPSQPAAHFASSKTDHHACCGDVRAQVKPCERVCFGLLYNNALRARGGRYDKVIISQFFIRKILIKILSQFFTLTFYCFFVLFCFILPFWRFLNSATYPFPCVKS